MVAWLAGVFAILAMALVIVGLYGIVAYLAASRRSEIGIRLALGSTRAQIVALVLRDNLWMMAAGIVIGLPLAVGAMRAARALLYGLSPTDGGMAAGATCLLAVAGVLAAAIPAWRAARVRLARRDALRVSGSTAVFTRAAIFLWICYHRSAVRPYSGGRGTSFIRR